MQGIGVRNSVAPDMSEVDMSTFDFWGNKVGEWGFSGRRWFECQPAERVICWWETREQADVVGAPPRGTMTVQQVRLRTKQDLFGAAAESELEIVTASEEKFYITPEEAEVTSRICLVFQAENFAPASAPPLPVEVTQAQGQGASRGGSMLGGSNERTDSGLGGGFDAGLGGGGYEVHVDAAQITQKTQTINQLFR
jgi:hypothetical protein